jgi:hypothetical protein
VRGLRPRLALTGASVAAVVVLGVVSTAQTLPDTWNFLSSQHSAYADFTKTEPNLVPEFQSLLPASVAGFFAQRVHRGQRFYVQVPEGRFIAGVDYPTAVRTFARYELLPAVEVFDPRAADVVFSIGADPHALGLAYERIERPPDDDRYAVARIRK